VLCRVFRFSCWYRSNARVAISPGGQLSPAAFLYRCPAPQALFCATCSSTAAHLCSGADAFAEKTAEMSPIA